MLMALLRRRRPRCVRAGLERELRPARAWRVDLRVVKDHAWQDRVLELIHAPTVSLAGVASHPPASGPEAEITLRVQATNSDAAERHAQRQLEQLGLTVVAVRSAAHLPAAARPLNAAAPG